MDLKEETILGDSIARHWYYRSKAMAMVRAISQPVAHRVLDVGSGSGFFSKYLLTGTDATEALCVDPSYPKEWDETINGKPLKFRRSCDAVGADLVLMMDVLEHVDDDIGLVADYGSKVPSGTRFLITVPAFAFLWSGHDVFLEHRRRYTIPMLQDVMKKAGLEVEQVFYYFGYVFPIVVVVRLMDNLLHDKGANPRSHLQRHSPIVNAILFGLCRAELPLMPINRFAGLSVFCRARKP